MAAVRWQYVAENCNTISSISRFIISYHIILSYQAFPVTLQLRELPWGHGLWCRHDLKTLLPTYKGRRRSRGLSDTVREIGTRQQISTDYSGLDTDGNWIHSFRQMHFVLVNVADFSPNTSTSDFAISYPAEFIKVPYKEISRQLLAVASVSAGSLE